VDTANCAPTLRLTQWMAALCQADLAGLLPVLSGLAQRNESRNLLACVELSMVDRNRVVAGLISILLTPAYLARALTEPLPLLFLASLASANQLKSGRRWRPSHHQLDTLARVPVRHQEAAGGL
jgi:hypothetical protein